MLPSLVLIKGAGDLASGVAHRLWNSGFQIVMLELDSPLVVRRTVSFASAVLDQRIEVEGVTAVLCPAIDQVKSLLAERKLPVLIDPEAHALAYFKPQVLIDGIMAKDNRVTTIQDAELVIGLGPGFETGKDVHAIIETKRGHTLGRVIYSGSALADTGEPGLIAGYGRERLLRAPRDGCFKPLKKIGDLVSVGDQVAEIEGEPIKAAVSGLVRGMLYPGLTVEEGTKVGDIDPRGIEVDFLTISDKARAIGGGVLEAILNRYNRS
jgi:xanthine dehydrogenase accessory factor